MKASDAFKAILENCGFENVVITEATPPLHVIDYMVGDDSEMTEEQINETIPYFRITSKHGDFGIIVGAYNLLDIKGTGCNALDLGEPDASEDFYLPSLNTESLKHLRTLMNRKKKLRKNMN